MSTQGPRFPTTITGNTGPGTRTWTNPANWGAADSTFVTNSFTAASQFTKDLIGTALGFSIPSTATINGITVVQDQSCTLGASVANVNQLMLSGAVKGSNKALAPAAGSEWISPTGANAVTYGSASDLWGTTWTPAQINDSTFGFVSNVTSTGSDTLQTDYAKITVTFTPGVAIGIIGWFRKMVPRSSWDKIVRGFPGLFPPPVSVTRICRLRSAS